jgi:hypothetical protein
MTRTRAWLFVAAFLAVIGACSGCAVIEDTACAEGKRLIRDGGNWTCATFYGSPMRGDHEPGRKHARR